MLGHALFPPECPVCLRESAEPGAACADCLSSLQAAALAPTGRCRHCFLPLHAGRCVFCAGRVRSFDSHLSLFPLNQDWRRVLHRWKFENERPAWRLFRPALDRIAARLRGKAPDRIGWIDSGREGYRRRAYQPCADPARYLAQSLGVPAGADLCKAAAGKQSGRSYADRFLALQKGLRCNSAALRDCRRYLLLEDVFTTGATANAAAAELKKNGVLTVQVVSLLLREEACD